MLQHAGQTGSAACLLSVVFAGFDDMQESRLQCRARVSLMFMILNDRDSVSKELPFEFRRICETDLSSCCVTDLMCCISVCDCASCSCPLGRVVFQVSLFSCLLKRHTGRVGLKVKKPLAELPTSEKHRFGVFGIWLILSHFWRKEWKTFASSSFKDDVFIVPGVVCDSKG